MKNNHKSLNFAVSMALFTVFALVLTLVLLMGASSFRNVAANAEERFNERTPLLYVSQKIRSFDRANGIKIENDMLILTENNHTTYIYHLDGYVRELLVFDDDEPRFELGISLFPAEIMKIEAVNQLTVVTINEKSILVNLMTEVAA